MEISSYIQLALALVVVIGLMAIFSLILKKMNAFQSGVAGRSNRLKIMEQRMIDTKHKAVIIRCDNKDHLVILSQNSDTVVIDTGITPPKDDVKKDNKRDIKLEDF